MRSTAIKRKLLLWFVTCGHIGSFPKLPGSLASLATCVAVFFFPRFFTHPLVVILFLGAALLAIHAVDKGGGKDPRWIVLDEVAGMLVTMIGHATGALSLLMGFILFRLFDILKPYPIKRFESLPGTWGIVADDVAAGLCASIVLFLGERFL